MTVLPEAIFFDFDGVILESVDVKTRAFAQLFESWGEEVRKAVVAYHLAHGGVSRYDKFRYYYKHLLGKPITEEKVQELAQAFEDLVYNGVLAAPFVPGADDFLARHAASISCFVVSGTPHEEINRIVDERGLRPYFAGVYGSPRSKGDWVAQLLREHNLTPARTLFVGDAPSDWRGATENNVPFIGRVMEGHPNPFQDYSCATLISDLRELPAVIDDFDWHG